MVNNKKEPRLFYMSEDIRIKFAKRLRELRTKRKLTQEDLAERSGLSYRHIQRLESAKNPPPVKIDSIQKIAAALKINPSKLLEF